MWVSSALWFRLRRRLRRDPQDPLAPQKPHGAPRAKNVIYLFMAGGPSQLELFDYKPKLQELNGQPIPQSFIEGKRFAFMKGLGVAPVPSAMAPMARPDATE